MEVAVSVAVGSLGPVLRKLQLLADECSRIKGIGKQIRFLRSELASMHALLRKVEAMEDEGPIDIQVKAWARDVREMAYDVEDCIDAFTHREQLLNSSSSSSGQSQSGGGVKEFIGRCTRLVKKPRSWRQFADQIDDLQVRVVEVGERRQRYKLDDLVSCASSTHSGVDPLLRALFADEDHLVGIDGPIDELASWLLEEDDVEAKNRKVLSIVGLGGLGKTTLANQVYLKIGGHFLCEAFVSVSQKPNLKHVLTDCLRQLCDDNKFVQGIGEWDGKTIITKTREYLADKRYLIVIDDVWSMSSWDAIECAFPRNNCSSRIIATTRIKDVAGSCCSRMNDRVYEMEPLGYSHSKRLFLKRIFGSNECHIQFQEVVDEILKKCGGLPLAIISISSLLANKPAVKEEWEKVRNSIGSALERDTKLEGIKAILNLSYNDLPHHLKTCLLYLGVFPEDCNIERSRLVNRWIAEGFIPQERGQSLQDVAESYFYELINKSMLQPTDVGYDGKARACGVHDIMLELIISKATEENFITIMGSQGFIAYPQCSIRRLSVQQADRDATLVLGGNNVSHVRSLTAFGLVEFLPSLRQFQLLRVLDFEGCMGLEKYELDNINRLTQLLYVSLRDTWISKLPSGIVKLHDLDTLDLRGTDIVELPAEIVCLVKLQHLLIAKSSIWLSTEYTQGIIKIPDGIGNMVKLQVLSGINISMSSADLVQDLSKLQNLKELHVQLDAEGHDQNRCEAFLFSLCKLGSCKLQYLWIRSPDSSPMEFLDSWSPLPCSLQRFRMTTSYYFLKMPKWIAPALTSLTYLNINLVEVKDEDLSILGELHALLYLELWFNTNQKERLTVSFRQFQCLKEFNFIRRPLEFMGEGYVVFETGALPKLEKLQLPLSVSMAKACGFYIGIGKLACLKYAEVTLGKVGAKSYESEAAAAAIRNEVYGHPNLPGVTIW